MFLSSSCSSGRNSGSSSKTSLRNTSKSEIYPSNFAKTECLAVTPKVHAKRVSGGEHNCTQRISTAGIVDFSWRAWPKCANQGNEMRTCVVVQYRSLHCAHFNPLLISCCCGSETHQQLVDCAEEEERRTEEFKTISPYTLKPDPRIVLVFMAQHIAFDFMVACQTILIWVSGWGGHP